MHNLYEVHADVFVNVFEVRVCQTVILGSDFGLHWLHTGTH